MNITYPHTLPRQLGAKTFIVWFLLACAEQEGIVPVSRNWLLDHMPAQTSPNSVTTALRWLCDPENQLAVRVTGGWRLASAMQLPLEIQKRAERPFEASSSSSAIEESENPLLLPDQKRAERPFEASSSSSSAMEESVNPLLLLDQKRAERAFQVSAKSKEDRQACMEACKETGIHEPAASQISALVWVTPNYIHDHVAEIHRLGQGTGLAVWRMKNQWDAPVDKTDGKRYASSDTSTK